MDPVLVTRRRAGSLINGSTRSIFGVMLATRSSKGFSASVLVTRLGGFCGKDGRRLGDGKKKKALGCFVPLQYRTAAVVRRSPYAFPQGRFSLWRRVRPLCSPTFCKGDDNCAAEALPVWGWILCPTHASKPLCGKPLVGQGVCRVGAPLPLLPSPPPPLAGYGGTPPPPLPPKVEGFARAIGVGNGVVADVSEPLQ